MILFSTDNNESSESFAFSVNVKKVSVDVDSFVEEGIRIKNVVLTADNVYYANDVVSVKKMGLVVDSNITKVILKANLSDGKVTVENLQIQDIDTLAWQSIFSSDTNESLQENQEDDNVTDEPQSPLIPHSMMIHQLEANILAREFDPVKIKEITLNSKEIYVNLHTFVVEKGLLTLDMKSNLSNLIYKGKINNNQLLGQVNVQPQEELFTQYNLPLRRESISDIKIDLDASQERVIAKIDTKMMQLLKAEKDAFNLDINSLKSLVTYSIKSATLKAESTATLNTPYGRDIFVTNIFTLDKNISYSGDISLKQLLGVDAKFTKAINDLNVKYVGDASSIHAKITI